MTEIQCPECGQTYKIYFSDTQITQTTSFKASIKIISLDYHVLCHKCGASWNSSVVVKK